MNCAMPKRSRAQRPASRVWVTKAEHVWSMWPLLRKFSGRAPSGPLKLSKPVNERAKPSALPSRLRGPRAP